MENKYENKVRERAEDFAKATHPDTWKAAKESLIEQFTPAARLSVQREAEAYTNAYMSFFLLTGGTEDAERHDEFYSNCQQELQSLGLIPQNTTTMYTEKQIETWRVKADQWDALEKRIAACYVTEGPDGEMEENTDPDIDLGTIGEIAASAFGYL